MSYRQLRRECQSYYLSQGLSPQQVLKLCDAEFKRNK